MGRQPLVAIAHRLGNTGGHHLLDRAEVIVWILPAVLAIRLLEPAPVVGFLELRNPGNGLLWGFGVGAVLAAVTSLEERFRWARRCIRRSSA